MRISGILFITMLSTVLLTAGCNQPEGPAEKALEGTKDALDMRDHEKLKDAGEDIEKAVDDAAEGIKDAAKGE